jgi:hypothetical protein
MHPFEQSIHQDPWSYLSLQALMVVLHKVLKVLRICSQEYHIFLTSKMKHFGILLTSLIFHEFVHRSFFAFTYEVDLVEPFPSHKILILLPLYVFNAQPYSRHTFYLLQQLCGGYLELFTLFLEQFDLIQLYFPLIAWFCSANLQ